jgi:hypothetical protein
MLGWVVAVGMVMALGAETQAPPCREITLNSVAQDRIVFSSAPEVAVSGQLYSGKTFPACLLAYQYAAQHPGAQVALCREERASMTMSTLRVLREEVLPLALRSWNSRFGIGWKESDSAVYLPRQNGRQSVIWIVGLDRPERLLSSDFALVIVDQAEQLSLAQFLLVSGRAARQAGMPDGRIVLLFNPDHPEHWANQRYNFGLGSRTLSDESGKPWAEVVVCDPNDNLENASERYRAVLERYTGVWRQRYRLNRWVGFEGSVFEAWNPNVHIVDPPQSWARWAGYPPPHWPRYLGVDFGYYPDPFVMAWWAESPEGKFYRYREIYHTKRLVEDHARDALKLQERELAALRLSCTPDEAREYAPYLDSFRLAGAWSDHDREDQETLRRHGVWTANARKDVLAGLQTVIGLLDPEQPGGPRLLLVRGALVERDPELANAEPRRPTCTEEEMGGYRYGKPDTAKRQLPVDRDNHGIDALRYFAHSMTTAPRVAVYA